MMTRDAERFHSLPYDRGEATLDLEYGSPETWDRWTDEFRYELGPEPPTEEDREEMARYCELRDRLDQARREEDAREEYRARYVD
jgi:hypothetical protein